MSAHLLLTLRAWTRTPTRPPVNPIQTLPPHYPQLHPKLSSILTRPHHAQSFVRLVSEITTSSARSAHHSAAVCASTCSSSSSWRVDMTTSLSSWKALQTDSERFPSSWEEACYAISDAPRAEGCLHAALWELQQDLTRRNDPLAWEVATVVRAMTARVWGVWGRRGSTD